MAKAPEGDKISVSTDERARLKKLREDLGWSQDELASRARTTQGTISNLENGERQIYVAVYQRIVAVLHGKDVSQEFERNLERIASGAAKLDPDQQKAVQHMIDALLQAQAKK